MNAPERFLDPDSFDFGAAHESELQYLFAATGAPSSPGQPVWPAFSSQSQQTLSLAPPQPRAETDFAVAHHCAFWSSVG